MTVIPSSASLSSVSVKTSWRQSLRHSGQKSAQHGDLNAQVVGERVAAFLRTRYPYKTADYVACDVGISVSTVRKWIERSSAPAAAHFGLLVYAYGVEFIAAIYPGLSWAETLIAMSKREAAAMQMAEADAQLAALRGRP